MANYKDKNNKVHHLDDTQFEYLLDSGYTLISDEEAKTLSDAYNKSLLTPDIVRESLYPDMQTFFEQWVAGSNQQRNAFEDKIKAIIIAYPG